MYVKDEEIIREGLERHAEQYVVFSLDVDDLACHSSDYVDTLGNTLTDVIFGPRHIEMLQRIQRKLTAATIELLEEMADEYNLRDGE